MGPVVLFAVIGLILLVTALGGSKLARETVMLIAGLMGATLIVLAALVFVASRVAIAARKVVQ
jgi:hypothetical protein